MKPRKISDQVSNGRVKYWQDLLGEKLTRELINQAYVDALDIKEEKLIIPIRYHDFYDIKDKRINI